MLRPNLKKRKSVEESRETRRTISTQVQASRRNRFCCEYLRDRFGVPFTDISSPLFRTPTVLPNTNITLETPRFDQKIPDSFRLYRGQGSNSEKSDGSDFSDSCTTCEDFSGSYTNSEYGSSGEEGSDSEIVSENNSDSGSFPPGRIDEDSQTTSTSDKKDDEKRSVSRQSNESGGAEKSSNTVDSGLRSLQLVWAKSRGYPWYPALIIDPDIPNGFVHNSVPLPCPPQHVLDLRKNRIDNEFLVLFFDIKRTWQWLPSGKLELLGINKSIDASKLVESRKPAVRKAVKKAYEEALAYQKEVTKRRPEGKL
jgi:bromodomain and PHD finger-containing protein 1